MRADFSKELVAATRTARYTTRIYFPNLFELQITCADVPAPDTHAPISKQLLTPVGTGDVWRLYVLRGIGDAQTARL
jgi:hypothetical protein